MPQVRAARRRRRGIGQDVLRAVYRKLDEFRHDRRGDTFRGWLWRVTASKIRDHRRRHPAELDAIGGSEAQRRLLEVADAAPLTAAEEKGLLLREALKQIKAEFKPQTWQAFWLVVIEGRAPADVARELRMSANAVYLAKSRVLQRFRAEFADLVDAKTSP